jgi:hypothetical protein
MTRKAKKRDRLCTYCQTAVATTADHVPPKNLFPKPRPTTLISVPCCEPCNRSVSKDDEYFRATLISRHDIPQSSAVSELMDAVYRGLAREEASGFRKAFLDATSEVEITTPAGLYIGRGIQFDANYDRLEAVAERMVRGLYFTEAGKP